jgi:hypothetical protein
MRISHGFYIYYWVSTLSVDYCNAVLPRRSEKQRKAHPYVPEINARTERGSNTAFWPWYRYLLSRSKEFCSQTSSGLLLNGLCLLSAICQLPMADLKRLSICVTFCLKLGKTVSEPHEKKSGFTVTTQKPKSSSLSGKTPLLHVRRRKVSFENIRNLFLQLKRVTSIVTGRFLCAWRSNSAENVRNDGRPSTRFTTAICRHTTLCLRKNYWTL